MPFECIANKKDRKEERCSADGGYERERCRWRSTRAWRERLSTVAQYRCSYGVGKMPNMLWNGEETKAREKSTCHCKTEQGVFFLSLPFRCPYPFLSLSCSAIQYLMSKELRKT